MKIITAFVAAAMLLLACKTKKETALISPANTTTGCDTLILRQICDYCEGVNSVYAPTTFSPVTRCLCYYSYEGNPVQKINDTIAKYKASIKHLTIENPSGIIYEVDFKNLTGLHTLHIFGNDYNTDRLSNFPADMLNQKSLKKIIFEGVRFDLNELEQIKTQYPKIEIVGKVDGLYER